MKIVFVHNYYQLSGGEDNVVKMEMQLLQDQGHDVILHSVSNNTITSLKDNIRVALSLCYSKLSKNELSHTLDKENPDLVHVHNFFPLLTPSIYDACIEKEIPVVQTLHNYRIICPGALLMRAGKICELCINSSAFQSVKFKCYKNSYIGTAFVANMVEHHRSAQTWHRKVNAFIALTDFAKNKYIESGIPESKIKVKPNFIDDPVFSKCKYNTNGNALFVGRISEEKGVNVLAKAWEHLDVKLDLVGVGPLSDSLFNSLSHPNINVLGEKSSEEVLQLMGRSKYLVFPSIWYEGFPMVIVEALAMGLPVICSNIGGMAEIIYDGKTGLHFEVGDPNDLVKKIMRLESDPDLCINMSVNARTEYLDKYTASNNYNMLLEIYETASRNA